MIRVSKYIRQAGELRGQKERERIGVIYCSFKKDEETRSSGCDALSSISRISSDCLYLLYIIYTRHVISARSFLKSKVREYHFYTKPRGRAPQLQREEAKQRPKEMASHQQSGNSQPIISYVTHPRLTALGMPPLASPDVPDALNDDEVGAAMVFNEAVEAAPERVLGALPEEAA